MRYAIVPQSAHQPGDYRATPPLVWAPASCVSSGKARAAPSIPSNEASGSYFIRVVANAACGSGAVSNEVLVSVP